MSLVIFLPLPPSKNKTKEPRKYIETKGKLRGICVNRRVTSNAVYSYRTAVKLLIDRALRLTPQRFDDKRKTILQCDWRKPSNRFDCSNWHQELADAIAPAIGVNDRYFLIRDWNYTIDKYDPGVQVEIWQDTSLDNP